MGEREREREREPLLQQFIQLLQQFIHSSLSLTLTFPTVESRRGTQDSQPHPQDESCTWLQTEACCWCLLPQMSLGIRHCQMSCLGNPVPCDWRQNQNNPRAKKQQQPHLQQNRGWSRGIWFYLSPEMSLLVWGMLLITFNSKNTGGAYVRCVYLHARWQLQ